MRRLIIAAAVLTVIGAASPAEAGADLSESFHIDPPETYAELRGLSQKIRQTARINRHFDIEASEIGARAWARAGSGALYVVWAVTAEPSEDPEASIRKAFDLLREAPVMASPQAGSTRELAYEESVEGDLARSKLVWEHLSNETQSSVRATAWASPEGIVHLIRTECVVPTGAEGDAERCEAAQESFRLTDAAGPRRELGELGEAATPSAAGLDVDLDLDPGAEAGEEGDGTDAPPADTTPTLRPPPSEQGRVLYDGGDGEEDRSATLLLILGGLAIVLAVWFTTRARPGETSEDEAEEEGEGAPGEEPEEGEAREGVEEEEEEAEDEAEARDDDASSDEERS